MMPSSAPAAVAEKGLPVDEKYSQPQPLPQRVPNVKDSSTYEKLYKESLDSPETFWKRISEEQVRWMQPWRKLKYEDFPNGDVRWFVDGKLNICDSAVDRWAETDPDRVALLWEGDDPTWKIGDSGDYWQVEKVTYKELLQRVCQMANLLKKYNVKKGDRVTVYMPMVTQAAVVMLACARIGAIHSVVFAGFSATSLKERILDAGSKVIITADQGLRGGKVIKLKDIVDDAIGQCAKEGFEVDNVLMFQRVGQPCKFVVGRDVWASEEVLDQRKYCPCEVMDSEDLLFMLYTSGSTGKPKGIAHSTGGYAVWSSLTHKYVFDIQPGDKFACVADIGWITGHSYIVYGPLINGTTTFMFESLPTFPNCSRYWEMVQRHQITQFYTAPTALRALMRFGDEPVKKFDRSSLRVLGSVGEPINPEAWRWYYDVVGDKRCPIVDTFWQTETGGFMLTPICGAAPMKPGSATLPFFGVEPVVLDPQSGVEIEGNNVSGILVMKRSWPGMLRTVYGDHQRMLKVYFSPYPGYYLTGDGCVRDHEGYYWITGRVDDVINVSGHRMGSAEIEHSLVQHPKVAESAVIGFPHEIKGEGIFCYVTLKAGVEEEPGCDLKAIENELKNCVRSDIGPIATPDKIVFTVGLPKTRSGKIMRRILRKLAANDSGNLGDTSTLADPSVVDDLIAKVAAAFG